MFNNDAYDYVLSNYKLLNIYTNNADITNEYYDLPDNLYFTNKHIHHCEQYNNKDDCLNDNMGCTWYYFYNSNDINHYESHCNIIARSLSFINHQLYNHVNIYYTFKLNHLPSINHNFKKKSIIEQLLIKYDINNQWYKINNNQINFIKINNQWIFNNNNSY